MNKKNSTSIFAMVMTILLLVSLTIAGCSQQPTETVGETTSGNGDIFIWDEITEESESTTQDTEPQVTVPATTDDGGEKETVGQETTPAATNPTQEETDDTKPAQDANTMTFEQYVALSAAEQKAFAKTFPTTEDFILWYNNAREAAGQGDVIEVTGPVDLGQYEN